MTRSSVTSDERNGGEKDLYRIIRIAMLAAVIAVTLGMANLPTVQSPKPAYVVTVTLQCGTGTTSATGGVFLYKTDKSGLTTQIGEVWATCDTPTATSQPMPKPDSWQTLLYINDPTTGNSVCENLAQSASPLATYPLDFILDCGRMNGWVYHARLIISATY